MQDLTAKQASRQVWDVLLRLREGIPSGKSKGCSWRLSEGEQGYGGEAYQLLELLVTYRTYFGVKGEGIGPLNTYVCNTSIE